MNFSSMPKIEAWLDQFDYIDRYIAEHFLLSLKYVSFSEFEESIQESIVNLISEIHIDNKCSIAIFPVLKPGVNKFNEKKEIKASNDSSGRIGHCLKNIERRIGNGIEVSPRNNSMIQKKVRHIIFVDDFVGTGNRFIKFWKNNVSRSVKSWVSGGYCKIWLVSHTMHHEGITNITKAIRAIDKSSLKFNLSIKKSNLLKDARIKTLIEKYGNRTEKKGASFGYGDICTPVIYQYGCPNNSPAILWSSGKSNNKRNSLIEGKWIPLFSYRSIDPSLYPLFKNKIFHHRYPELLWSSGQYNLALKFCNDFKNRDSKNKTKLILIILALANKGLKKENLLQVLTIERQEALDVIEQLISLQLLTKELRVTKFGKDTLQFNRSPKSIVVVDKDYENFYPSVFLGFPREI